MPDDWKDVDDWQDVEEEPRASEPRIGMGDLRVADAGREPTIAGLQSDINLKMGLNKADRQGSRVEMLEKILAAMQTGSLGLGDEMSGVKAALSGGDYRKAQKSAEATAKDAQGRHPFSSLAGVVPHMLVPGAASLPGRVATAGYTSGVAGAGEVSGGASASDVMKDAAGSAEDGMLLQAGMEAVSPVLGRVARGLRGSVAPGWALKAAGLRAGIANRAEQLGLNSEDEALAMGREFLDKDLIPVAGSKAGVNARAEGLRVRAGEDIDDALGMGDASGVAPDFDRAQWAAARPALEASAYERQTMAQPVKKLLRGLESEPDQSWQMLNRVKSKAGGGINWAGQPSGSTALARASYGSLSDDITEQLGEVVGPGASQMLRSGNADYGTALTAKALSGDEGLRGLARQGLTVKDVAAGLGSGIGSSEGPPVASGIYNALIAKLDALVKERGPALGARAADDVAAPLVNLASRANQLPAALGAGQTLTPEEEERQRLLQKYQDLMR